MTSSLLVGGLLRGEPRALLACRGVSTSVGATVTFDAGILLNDDDDDDEARFSRESVVV